jgi:hypothetical protein
VFLVLEIGTRREDHRHPTAEWTTPQFRSGVTGKAPYRFVVQDRDAIYSPAVDRGLAVHKSSRAEDAARCAAGETRSVSV